MPYDSTIVDMQSETARQQALDYAQSVANSSKNGGRNVGGDMGKNDFLLLLSVQLRHQDPLEPEKDSDFAAQLAQFSALEQMQNMNTSLATMSSYQSYSLVGKFVMAETYINGEFAQFTGIVDSIFVSNGIVQAQIGQYVVPVSAIVEVFDTGNILTTEMFMQTASMLIGRTVVADVDGKEIEGTVTRIVVENGLLYAQIDDGTDEPKFVPVNSIVDIREAGTDRFTKKPDTPPEAQNFKPDPDSDGFLELDPEDPSRIIGRWDWDNSIRKWVYTEITNDDEGDDPIGEIPSGETGGGTVTGGGNDGDGEETIIGDGDDGAESGVIAGDGDDGDETTIVDDGDGTVIPGDGDNGNVEELFTGEEAA